MKEFLHECSGNFILWLTLRGMRIVNCESKQMANQLSIRKDSQCQQLQRMMRWGVRSCVKCQYLIGGDEDEQANEPSRRVVTLAWPGIAVACWLRTSRTLWFLSTTLKRVVVSQSLSRCHDTRRKAKMRHAALVNDPSAVPQKLIWAALRLSQTNFDTGHVVFVFTALFLFLTARLSSISSKYHFHPLRPCGRIEKGLLIERNRLHARHRTMRRLKHLSC